MEQNGYNRRKWLTSTFTVMYYCNTVMYSAKFPLHDSLLLITDDLHHYCCRYQFMSFVFVSHVCFLTLCVVFIFQIIWKAQAICETHSYKLEIHGKTAVRQNMYSCQYYVWDQLSLVFHINKGEVLTFPQRKLKASLSCCEADRNVNLSNGENCSSIKEAEQFLESLQDDEKKERRKKMHLRRWKWKRTKNVNFIRTFAVLRLRGFARPFC